MNHYLLEAAAASSTKASIVPGRSRAARWSVGLIGAIGLTASVLAGLTTWLLVTDPVAAAQAVSTGHAEVLLHAIEAALVDILRTLVGYLQSGERHRSLRRT